MHVRVASEADIPDMHRIRMSVRENRLLDPARVQPADYGPMLTGHGRGWVAELDHQVVGFAVANLSRAKIWALFVDPDHEGRGVGRALHDTMLTWVFASGPERVSLTTDPGNRASASIKPPAGATWGRSTVSHVTSSSSRTGLGGIPRPEICRILMSKR